MCSTQCDTPVSPGRSSFDPTLYQHHTEASGAVCSSCTITLNRPDKRNALNASTIAQLRATLERVSADPDVRVIIVRANGPAFCAGYGLDWSTAAQASEPGRPGGSGRVWDSVADYRMMSRYVATYMKLWYAAKPTIAAVQGWCVGGGRTWCLRRLTVAGEGACFGYPPSRVWGTPTTAMWVYRMGLERAKRYMLTGDEIPAVKAAEIGLILECVADADLDRHARASPREWLRCRPRSSSC
jgi:enoyl-CoA hydratase